MTNAETISKLSEALNTLIGAYEDIQNEKNELEKTIVQLKDEKNDLDKKLNDFNNNNERQNSNINSMLGKIENILGNNPEKNEKKEEIPKKETEIKEMPLETTNIFDSVNAPKEDTIAQNIKVNPINNTKEEVLEKDDEKLDLNRMASLLNGFNR